MRPATLQAYATEAGFAEVKILPIENPFWRFYRLEWLAVTTERIRLGLNVCYALYQHPVLTARLAADLDNMSNGRLILGPGLTLAI
jgi:alkanesulfonate monooxygenase SsuD/methylene tetrahydromethanopterin reductase-like flavin-dependent oxidoreductase (luciferase family)